MADAAVVAAARAWRQIAERLPAVRQEPADTQDWAVQHLAFVVGSAVVTDLRAALPDLPVDNDTRAVLDAALVLAQQQLLDAHETSCLSRTLNAPCLTGG